MSLVHQVLKSIDQRKHTQGIAVPQALQIPPETEVGSLRFAWISVGIAIVIGLIAWFFWQHTIYIKPLVKKKQPLPISSSVSQTPAKSVHKEEKTAVIFPETHITTPDVKVVKELPEKKSEAIKRSLTDENSHLKISRRGQRQQQIYVDILSDMKARRWQRALNKLKELRTKTGLSITLEEKLLHNQLRIYVEQKRFDDFRGFYQQHQSQASVAWLSTAAPGLHMIGDYETAIESYRKLMKAQPGISNWPIAMALAMEQSQLPQQAQKTLKSVLTRYSLEPKQRVWVEQKLTSLSSGNR